MTPEQREEFLLRDREWDAFLSTLTRWEVSWLCKSGNELPLHDRFVGGKILMADVERKIVAAFAR